MKRNAIARIVIHSVTILLLTGILMVGMGLDMFLYDTNSGTSENGTNSGAFAPADISNLDIDWAAGSIAIRVTDTDAITVTESGDFAEKYTMCYSVSGSTLSIDYAKSSVVMGFGNLPKKDLIITVPEDWVCKELDIDGAALEVTISSLEVGKVTLDGAGMTMDFDGAFQELSCDGAGCELQLTTAYATSQVELDGAGCELTLILPLDCGFQVLLEGLGCSYSSDIPGHQEDGCIVYGDRSCHIDVDGLGCHVGVYYTEPIPTVTE